VAAVCVCRFGVDRNEISVAVDYEINQTLGSLMRNPLNVKVNGKSVSAPTGQTQTTEYNHTI
jgi:hypothetical protein